MTKFIVESGNGHSFNVIATVNSVNDPGALENNYIFTDPENISGVAFYRINMRNVDGRASYSQVLELTIGMQPFSFVSVINPFANALYFDIASSKDGSAQADLIDQFGKQVKNKTFDIKNGVNQLTFENTSVLSPGVYILRVQLEGSTIYRRVMKQNH